MVVIIYCYLGCDDEVTTLNENREDHDVDIFIIQKVQDTEASGKSWLPRSILVRATTHRCSSYIDLAMVPR